MERLGKKDERAAKAAATAGANAVVESATPRACGHCKELGHKRHKKAGDFANKYDYGQHLRDSLGSLMVEMDDHEAAQELKSLFNRSSVAKSNAGKSGDTYSGGGHKGGDWSGGRGGGYKGEPKGGRGTEQAIIRARLAPRAKEGAGGYIIL